MGQESPQDKGGLLFDKCDAVRWVLERLERHATAHGSKGATMHLAKVY